MHVRRWLSLTAVLIASLLVFAACSKKNKAEKEEAADQAAPVEAEAPRIVVAMIDAHGGMPGWRVAKTLAFTNEFQMADDSVTTTSRVTIDLAQRRAYADVSASERMAWDGKRAWGIQWTQPYPARLRAVLDCYMTQLPWLAMDPSAKVSVAPEDTLWDNSVQYKVVKMSFRPAAPGGPYRLYIDPDTKRLHACAFNAAEGEETERPLEALAGLAVAGTVAGAASVFRMSRISVSNSSDLVAGGARTASRLKRLTALTSRNRAKAMIAKLKMLVMKLP